MHFNAGSKDTAEAIISKLESSRAIASVLSGSPTSARISPDAAAGTARSTHAPIHADPGSSPSKKGVHFSELSPAIIPPREPSDSGDEADESEGPNGHIDGSEAHGQEAIALYDFQAQGNDELTVIEGEKLWIIERDSDEWWKCRNANGEEGVVPASYMEVSASPVV